MKEVYYVMGHGLIQSNEVLDHKQRYGIPIISVGTEGEITYPSPIMLLIPYFMKIHGNLFMNKLLTILLKHGEKYITGFKPNGSRIEQDIRFLFDVNREDLKYFPSNVLRAYYGAHTNVLNTIITCSKPNETFLYTGLSFHNTTKFRIIENRMLSVPNSQYKLNDYTFYNQDKIISLTNPFGIFKFDEKTRTFDMKHRMTKTHYTVGTILKYIHEQSSKKPIVFMIHCKEPDKQVLMDFDFKKYPIEKGYKKSLEQLMTELTLKQTPPIKTTRKRKQRSPPEQTTTKKRTKITIVPTPTKTTRKRKQRSPPEQTTTKKRTKITIVPTPTKTTRKRKQRSPPEQTTTTKKRTKLI